MSLKTNASVYCRACKLSDLFALVLALLGLGVATWNHKSPASFGFGSGFRHDAAGTSAAAPSRSAGARKKGKELTRFNSVDQLLFVQR